MQTLLAIIGFLVIVSAAVYFSKDLFLIIYYLVRQKYCEWQENKYLTLEEALDLLKKDQDRGGQYLVKTTGEICRKYNGEFCPLMHYDILRNIVSVNGKALDDLLYRKFYDAIHRKDIDLFNEEKQSIRKQILETLNLKEVN